jgi:hypothetical protein
MPDCSFNEAQSEADPKPSVPAALFISLQIGRHAQVLFARNFPLSIPLAQKVPSTGITVGISAPRLANPISGYPGERPDGNKQQGYPFDVGRKRVLSREVLVHSPQAGMELQITEFGAYFARSEGREGNHEWLPSTVSATHPLARRTYGSRWGVRDGLAIDRLGIDHRSTRHGLV